MVLAERRRLADLERDYVDEREARRGVDVGARARTYSGGSGGGGGRRERSMTGEWTELPRSFDHGSSPGRRGVRFANDR